MKKKLKLKYSFLFFICFSLFGLLSCGSRKAPPTVVLRKTETIKEVEKDTIFKIEADSTYYKAFVECQNGKAVLVPSKTEPKTNKNKVETALKHRLNAPKVILNTSGLLQVDCITNEQELYKKWKEKQSIITIEKPVYIEKIVEVIKEKEYRWWQKMLFYTGLIFYLIIIITISLFKIYQLIKKR